MPVEPVPAADAGQAGGVWRRLGQPILDGERGVSAAVAEHDGRRGAGCVAGDVGERLLGAAVEREARLRRERARAALDRQRHVRVHVVSECRDERLELRDAGEFLAAECADGLPGVGEAVADQLAGALDRGPHLRARLLALGELARALQLDRRAGERVREHVVELARDPAALRDGRRPQLLLARVLELGEQQLGRVLARSRLLDEVGDQRRAARTAGSRRGPTAAEPPASASASASPTVVARRERGPERQRQARDGHPDRGAAGELGRPMRLQRNERHSGRAHRGDHRGLHRHGCDRRSSPRTASASAAANTTERGGDAEPLAVPGRARGGR